MKTFLVLSCCAALLAGCDVAGELAGESADGPSVALNALTIHDWGRTAQPADADGSAPDVLVEVTDGTGRALYRSAVLVDLDQDAAALDLGGTELMVNGLGKFVYVYRQDAAGQLTPIAQSEAFTTAQLNAAGHASLGARQGTIAAEITASPAF